MHTAIQDTSNVIQYSSCGVEGKERIKMFYKGNGVLLLLSWSIDVGKKKGNVVAAHKRHEASVIEKVTVCFFLATIGSFVGVFTAVDSGVWNRGFVAIGRAITSGLYTDANCINL